MEELTKLKVEKIDVTAEPTSGLGSAKHKSAKVESGNVTLVGLLPDTLYKLSLEGIRNKSYAFFNIVYARTLAVGKFSRICIPCILWLDLR